MDVLMPQLGETVAEGKILAWFKTVGDPVAAGERLFEVETDKVTLEVEAIDAGTVAEIRTAVGETVKVGTVVARLAAEGAVVAPTATIAPVAAPMPATSPIVAAPIAVPSPAAALDPFEEVRTAPGRYGRAAGPEDFRITPLARRLLAQTGVDVAVAAEAARARHDRRIRACDVETAQRAAAPKPSAAPAATPATAREPARPLAAGDGVAEVRQLNQIRRRTGERLAESWRTVPHVFQAIDVDFGAIDEVRARHKERFRARTGASLTYLPFIARAACLALGDFPLINARLDGDRLLVMRDVHLGIAVDLGHEGLMVPVIRSASDLTLEGLARAIVAQVAKARAGTLGPDDLSGATYSISNNGAFGTLFTAPIVNPPQVAILSTDAVRKRPAVVETAQGDFLAVRPIGMVAQCFDHRAFDGAYSAAFLSRLEDILERRDWAAEFA